MSDIIRLMNVEIGDNPYHLIFTGFIPRKDPNREYEFDFIGTELGVNTYLPNEAIKELCEQLLKKFGYAPYDEDKAKQILKNNSEFYINF